MQSNANVLQVENIITRFNTQDGKVFAVNGISFDLKEEELLGVVGESGSGKSVTMMSLLKLLPMPPAEIVEGRALFENQDLIQMDLNQLRKIRGGKIGFIFQDPMTSLNPVLTVGYQLMEPMREHLGLSREEARKKAIELLDLVGIPMAQSRLKDFPHQFSGGMRQRVMIAIALACDPKVLIADEPTTALDVTIQAQILDIVKRLRKELEKGRSSSVTSFPTSSVRSWFQQPWGSPMPSSQNLPCHSWGLDFLRIFQPGDACFMMVQLSSRSLLHG